MIRKLVIEQIFKDLDIYDGILITHTLPIISFLEKEEGGIKSMKAQDIDSNMEVLILKLNGFHIRFQEAIPNSFLGNKKHHGLELSMFRLSLDN